MVDANARIPCATCGIDLSGALPADACPYCGRGIGETINLAVVDPATRSVSDDVSCVGCGYNLRTLSIVSVCPECARPVAESIRPGELRLADPRWLRRLQGGVSFLLIAGYGWIVLLAVPLFWDAFLPRRGPATTAAAVFVVGLAILFFIAMVSGVFELTAREPRLREPCAPRAIPTMARCLVLLPILLLGLAMLFQSALGVALLTSATLVCVVGSFACTFVCARCLARRGRRPGLARLTTVLIWTLVGSGATMVPATVLTAIQIGRVTAPRPPVPAPAPTPGVVRSTATAWVTFILWALSILMAYSAWALAIVSYVLGLIVLGRYRKLLASALRAGA